MITKARRGFLLRLALSAVALFLVARLVSGRELWQVIGSAHWPLLLCALVVGLADRLMMAWKWRMLLQGLGVHRRRGGDPDLFRQHLLWRASFPPESEGT